MYLILSIILSLTILFIIHINALNYFKNNYDSIINIIMYSMRDFIYYFIGDTIYVILVLIFTIPIYAFFMHKNSKNWINILETVEDMSEGNLNKIIDINSNDSIGKLAKNINSIIVQLRNITIEERKAQQTKTDLITNVSHDLRTPLTSIIGYLGLIDEDKYKDEVELRYYTNIAYEKSKNLNVLINDLFEFTKMQNNTIKIDKQELNLVELLGQIMEHFSYQFKINKVEGRVQFSEDKLTVNADANKLVRAFENIINNAIKYGKDGYYIDLFTKKEDDMAVVQIINYGEPISPIDLPYLFDRFYRIEKSRNNNKGGSGLGLAITKNIINLHEGDILVISDNAKTVFEIKLPLKNTELI
ncbi:sensor histidine kinase [Romboutsia maritimum]|uniref:histidine kinase n=2 Tax=Romboutsia maritimum TaxID=2020948 RepID=A0A371IQB0_9FIRM|nr:sensor histidine kinase [Romboutsia maritimum]